MYLFRPSDQAQSESTEFYFHPNQIKMEQSQVNYQPILVKRPINKPNITIHADCGQKEVKDNVNDLSSKILSLI